MRSTYGWYTLDSLGPYIYLFTDHDAAGGLYETIAPQ